MHARTTAKNVKIEIQVFLKLFYKNNWTRIVARNENKNKVKADNLYLFLIFLDQYVRLGYFKFPFPNTYFLVRNDYYLLMIIWLKYQVNG